MRGDAPDGDLQLRTIASSRIARTRLDAVAIDLEARRIEVEATGIRVGMQERVKVKAVNDIGAIDAGKVHAEVHILHAA